MPDNFDDLEQRPARDLLLVLTDFSPGVYEDEDGDPVMVGCLNGKNYMMLWYDGGAADDEFNAEAGDLLFKNVWPKSYNPGPPIEGIEMVEIDFTTTESDKDYQK